MDGYDVITSDDHKAGSVVRVDGDLLIIESGLLRKSHHAVPLTFAQVNEDERVVRLTLAREIVDDSPQIEDDELDRRAIAEHYGLASGYDEPETQGYGDVVADDPAWGAEYEERRTGVEPAAERRARIREGESDAGPHGRPIIPPDPHEGP
jgi:hypothetical protein